MKRLPLAVALAVAGAAAGCAPTEGPPRALPPQLLPDTNHPNERVSGPIGSPTPLQQPLLSYGTPGTVSLPSGQGPGAGDVSLDFADTDIREVVAQILGSILRVNYTIDPAVHGTATLHTVTPLARSQLLPTLEALLSETGATLVDTDGLYRVVPAAAPGSASASSGGLAGGGGTSGDQLVPLHYVSATDLAKVLQPFAGQSARIAVDPGSNSLVIAGDPDARDALVALAQAFDTNLLAGQSYALLPSPQGGAADFATELQTAFRAQGQGLTNLVRVVPMERAGAVLVIASQPDYIDAARRVYDLLERKQRATVRSWNVYYLKDAKAEDAAYLLQEAFTPDNVTATPSSTTTSQQSGTSATGTTGTPGIGTGTSAGAGAGGSGQTAGSGGIGTGTSINGTSGGILGGGNPEPAATGGSSSGQSAAPSQTAANPLLGGLGAGGGAGGGSGADALRIIPDDHNNSVMIYSTQDEEERIDAMLRKIDILPLQVRIDATIAEVTLNSALQYGTQFFFRSGGINGILNNTAAATPLGTPTSTVLSTAFPGFVLSGNGAGGAPIALQALQAVTTVKVLSSPELMVLDGETARLQVGQLVPYLTSSSQSTVANSAVINNINYQPTGVIMSVTPRISEGGRVTLDISQQVSAVDTSVNTTTTGISSPTFSEQDVSSRVTVQDGQTVGLAGLITDNLTKTNSGIPFLKDIPLIGLLAGTQNNTRTRDELLILITPHVQFDENDARALTADLQSQLQDAATVPGQLNSLQSPGSDDPNAVARQRLRLDQ